MAKRITRIEKEYGNNKPQLQHNKDGVGFIDWHEVNARINLSLKNDKIGLVLNISFPIHYTCDHCKECYRSKECYGMHCTYCFPDNQIRYSENLKYFIENTEDAIVKAMIEEISKYPKYKLFRWFAIGDILNEKMLNVIVRVAEELPDMMFYGYTKKHALVNRWLDKNGDFPENLNLMFSLWTFKDGTVETVDNPHGLQTALYIPCGMEDELLTEDMFICPCASGEWVGHCSDCSGCPTGQHKAVAFLEHSTAKTKDRDKKIKAERTANKANGKGVKTA